MSTVRIADITYDSVVDGPGLRTVIWFQGCSHHCKNCHNPETWAPDKGNEYDVTEIAKLIDEQEKVTLSGGDPLFQIDALEEIMKLIQKKNVLDIWLYTGYTYDKFSELVKDKPNILDKISVVKCGPFIEALKDLNCKFRGSSNQEFYRIKDGKIYNITESIDRGDFNV